MTAAPNGPVSPPPPHGGRLTERLVTADRAGTLAAEAARLAAVRLDGRGLADLECLAVGAFSPLTGFLGAADHTGVVEQGRLVGGQVWTLPVVLAVPAEVLASGPERLALADQAGTVLAVVDVEEVHDPDPVTEAKVEPDPAKGGMVKLNPLADWTREQVWAYARANQVPIHPLYEPGSTSIGCAPWTRAVLAGEDERGGRWWWEADPDKECGLDQASPSARLDRALAQLGAEVTAGGRARPAAVGG